MGSFKKFAVSVLAAACLLTAGPASAQQNTADAKPFFFFGKQSSSPKTNGYPTANKSTAAKSKSSAGTLGGALTRTNADTAARVHASADARSKAYEAANAQRYQGMEAYSQGRTHWTTYLPEEALNSTPVAQAPAKPSAIPPSNAKYRYDPEAVAKERKDLPKLFNAPVR